MQKTYLYLLQKKRHHHRYRNTKKVMGAARPFGIGLLAVVLILFSSALLLAGLFYARITRDLPSLEELPVLLNPVDGELLQPTRITDRSGQSVLYTFANPGIERKYLSVNPESASHFSPQLLQSVVAGLDPNFWENPGYSLENWRDPRPQTIAERLVSELLLWQEPQSTARSIRMRLLAAQIVSTYGRTQVLEWYLNSAWFGKLAVGAESASQLYFQKSAQDLDLAESAMLSVLLDAPALNPLDAPDSALEMQRLFLATMAENQIISVDDFSSALHEPLHLRTSIDDPISSVPAFTRHLIQSLSSAFPENRLLRGGLIIRSTLDLDLQNQFLCTAQIQLLRLRGDSSGITIDPGRCPAALLLPTQVFSPLDTNSISAAGMITNPQTGEVLAYLEPTTLDGQRSVDGGYQPGSLLSPFVALAGFARGLSPATLEWDIPPSVSGSNLSYQNADRAWHGPISLRSAVANDYLLPVTDVLSQAGTANAWRLASALGLDSLENAPDSDQPLFGGTDASLSEIAEAYGTLANSGLRSGALNTSTGEIDLNFILDVGTPSGRLVLDRSTPAESSVLSTQLSYLINNVLSDESARWPSLGYPNALEIGETAAAKLGSVSTHTQAWTVGYTPQRLVLVWLGETQTGENSQTLDPLMAAGIWHAVIKQSLLGLENSAWSAPEGISRVKVCTPSGMLPSSDCPTTGEEVFLTGNEPTQADTLYERIKVNRETGQRATVYTDPALIDEGLFLNVPARAHAWAVEAGLAVAPSGYDAIPVSQPNPDVQITSPVVFSPVGGKVSITGTAAGTNLSSWTVQIGEGINPSSWLEIASGNTKVSNARLTEWDTTVLDGLYAIRLSVVRQDQSVQSSIIQVTVDNDAPLVKITYPAADQQVTPVSGSVTLQAEVTDSAGLLSVEWWLDGKKVATQQDGPYLYRMSAASGRHTLQVIAVDNAGNKTPTNKLEFTVAN